MNPTLIIVRGLPGSGKSTYSRSLSHAIHLEADMFFTKETGEYLFDRELISRAHHWCLDSAKIFLRQGRDVVVSNTFTTCSELSKYVKFAIQNNIGIEVVTRTEHYGSIHNVPDDTMDKMKLRLISHEEVINYIDRVRSGVLSENNT